MSSTPRFELAVRTPSTLPNVTTDHVAYVRAWTTSGAGSLDFDVRQGSTVIQSWTISITATPTTYALALDPANVATITNYGDLRLSWTGTGTSGEFVRVGKPTYLAIPVGPSVYRILHDGAGGADSLARGVVRSRTLADGAAAADVLTPSETYAERTTPRFEVGVRNPTTTPEVDTDHTAYVRAWVTTGTGYIDFDVRQGTTVIETWTLVLSTTPTTFVLPLDPTNVATITDYNDLRLSWVGRGPGGGVGAIRVGKPTYLSIPIGTSAGPSTLSDDAGAVDSLARSAVSARTLADGAAGGDFLARAETRSLADVAAATDVLTRSTAWSRSLSDNAAASDSLANSWVASRTLNDTAAASDALARSVSQARSLVDGSAASDTLSRQLAETRTVSDGAAATDSLTRSSVRSESLADGAAAADALARTLVEARTLSDGAAAADTLVRSQPITRTVSDDAAASDVLVRSSAVARSLADAAAAADALARAVVDARTLSDNASAGDALTFARPISRALADNASASDSLSRTRTSSRSLADNAAASDSLASARTRSLADNAAATDSISRHLVVARSLADAAAATDGLGGRVVPRSLADGAAAVDSIAAYTNDYFISATDIGSGASGTRPWQNVGYIFFEPYEPENVDGQWTGLKSAWFKFTPTVDGIYQIDTIGSDPAGDWLVLSAFTGTDIAALTLVGYGGINSGGPRQARMTFNVTAGVTYHFKVAPYSLADISSGVLNWQSVAAGAGPGNDNFVDAFLLTGASGSTTGSTYGATLQTGEPAMPFADSTTTVWWKWVASGDGILQLDFTGSSGDMLSTIYKGTTLANLKIVGANDSWYLNGVKQGDSYTRVRVQSGATYYIQVAGATSTWSNVSFTWDLQSVTVANDDFASATIISGASGTLSGVLTGASSELGEPWLYPPGTPVTADVDQNWYARDTFFGNYDWGGWSRWYSWTCPSSGVYQFDTIGSGEFTVLGVFLNAATISQLDRSRGRANAYGSGSRSLVTMRCTAGQVYKIVVEGDYGGTGDFVVNWATVTPPVNDDIANAIEISGSGTLTGSTFHATMEDGEIKVPGMYGSGRSVWYKFNVCSFMWPYLKATGYVADGLAIMAWNGPENATVDQLTFDEDHILYDYDQSGYGSVQINQADFSFADGTKGPWVYVQVDSYDGIGTDFTLEYNLLGGVDELTYTGPSVAADITHTSVELGYLCLNGSRRNVDVHVNWTSPDPLNQSIALHAVWWSDPLTQIAYPALPATTNLGSHYQNGQTLPARAYSFTGSGAGSYIASWRLAIPEGATGLLEVYVESVGQIVDAYHVSFSEFDRPSNDQALNAIPLSGTGTYAISPEAWAGATQDIERNPEVTVLSTPTKLSLGRSLWFSWTPQRDNESLFFWEDTTPRQTDDETGAIWMNTELTVFTDPEQTKILYGSAYWDWFSLVNDPADPHPKWDGAPGPYNYYPVPARHDVAKTRAGSTYYLRLDLRYDSPLPLFDWNVGWFVSEDPTEQYGPDDYVILSSGDIESDEDNWYMVGHKDQDQHYLGYADPSYTAISGRMGKQLPLPHPLEETALVPSTEGPGTLRSYDYGDIDDDGTVYATGHTAMGNSFANAGFVNLVDVWDRGVLAEATHDRFKDALDHAAILHPDLDITRLSQVNIVGDEVWIGVAAVSGGARVKCSKEGDFLGVVYRNFFPMNHIDAARTKFISANQVWDTQADTITTLGVPAGGRGYTWVPWKNGLVRGNIGSNAWFSGAPSSNSISSDVNGNGWSRYPLNGGGSALVTKLPFRDALISTSWTAGTFPTHGGVVWRLVDSNNYLVAKSSGVYEAVNGVETLIASYTSFVNWGLVTSMSVRQIGNGAQFRVNVNGSQVAEVNGNITHRKTFATSGLMIGIVDNGPTSPFNTLDISNLGLDQPLSIDVVKSYDPWDGTYHAQDWNLGAEIVKAEGWSPWFDTMSQSLIEYAIGKDGTTLYCYRWSELYDENARDYGYQNLTGNWIVTHVYAFDLEHKTYLGKVGKYDVYPSHGGVGYYNTLYPQLVMGGVTYSGLRGKAAFSHLQNRIDRPTSVMRSESLGPAPAERAEALDGPDARIAASAGLEIEWTTAGRVQRNASVSDYLIQVTGDLIGITLSAERAGTTTTTVTITRNEDNVGTVILSGGETHRAFNLSVPWTSGQKFGFTVNPGSGLYGLTVQGNWVT